MRSIKLIVGLGNPGREYEATRHNAGAAAVTLFVREQRWSMKANRFLKILISEARIEEDAILCCFPQTFMNLSGSAVAKLAAKKKISLKNILIVHDDVDLPLGTVRFKVGGSDGGHNGVASVIERLGTRDFARLRIGIGPKPAAMDLADFVLFRFTREELAVSAKSIARAAEAIGMWVREDFPKCMNTYNAKSRKE